MITFDDSFFEAEVRNGFRVPSMMKHCWAAEMEVMGVIGRLCEKHGIQYFADWGTLLGAVRHKGYIPWDDDIDLAMKRPDYERFWRIAEKELPKDYQVINIYTDEQYLSVNAKIYNSHTLQFTPEYLQMYHGCPYVIVVDIFPIDYVPRVKEEEQAQMELISAVNTVAEYLRNPDVDQDQLAETIKMIETACNVRFDPSQSMFHQLAVLGEQLACLYGPDDSDYLTQMFRLVGGQGFYVPKEAYDKAIMMPFENIEIPVPVGYDEVLKLEFGDYMTMIRSNGSHEYPFYKDQQEILREMLIENHIPLSAFYFEE